ncbi:MAG TPA: nucleotidyltransferase substrate binding protein [Gemmataceae bacterium]|jgi:nucleotidyltransferase substrate binding protein (TIGR01987 family)|nr:nucleotidyltransferase substrate binding protein [Gemmataceae bacterium]
MLVAVPLDLSPLEDALAQLDEGLQEAEHTLDSELLRDGVIQRFEYSHELAVKFIRRALEVVYGDPVDQMAYNDMLRTAGERGLVTNVEGWFRYRTARNKTSHTYDAAVAAEVYRFARPFLRDALVFLDRLHAIHRSAA